MTPCRTRNPRLPLLKTPEGAILASNEPESGECRLNPQGRARPGARQPTTPITGRILWRVLPLS